MTTMDETLLLLGFGLIMFLCLCINTDSDSTVRKRKKKMDQIELLLNMLVNTWTDYRMTADFTEEEEDQIRDKVYELGELITELYNYHDLDD